MYTEHTVLQSVNKLCQKIKMTIIFDDNLGVFRGVKLANFLIDRQYIVICNM